MSILYRIYLFWGFIESYLRDILLNYLIEDDKKELEKDIFYFKLK